MIESISILLVVIVIDAGVAHLIDGTPPVTGRPQRWHWIDQLGPIAPCRFFIVFAIVVEKIGGGGGGGGGGRGAVGCGWVGRVVARVS